MVYFTNFKNSFLLWCSNWLGIAFIALRFEVTPKSWFWWSINAYSTKFSISHWTILYTQFALYTTWQRTPNGDWIRKQRFFMIFEWFILTWNMTVWFANISTNWKNTKISQLFSDSLTNARHFGCTNGFFSKLFSDGRFCGP